MNVIWQNADCDGFAWMLRMNGLIHAPKAVDMPDQQVAAAIGQRHREEEDAAFDLQSTIP